MMWQRKNNSIMGSLKIETAATLPVVMLLTFAMLNLAMAWNAAVDYEERKGPFITDQSNFERRNHSIGPTGCYLGRDVRV